MELRRLIGDDAVLPADSGGIDVAGLSADSRQIKPGFLFAAFSGAQTDGTRFAKSAIEAGAVAVLAAEDSDLDLNVPVIRAANPRRALALAASRFYGEQPGTICAVTGTSGKTSVSVFLRQIWEAQGLRAASVGTIGVVSPSGETYSGLTTPDPVGLARLMSELRGEGVSHAAMEASSHGLDQYRLDGLKLAAGAFLNLGRDHLDYHPTVEDYFQAKMRLFTELLPPGSGAVIDADDPHSERVIAIARERGLQIMRSGEKGDEIRLISVRAEGYSQHLDLEVMGEAHQVELPLAGRFQISNALVAAGLAIITGTPVVNALSALENLHGASGRLERVGNHEGVLAFVDYAHKPDAVVNALAALRPFAKGRLIVVLGAGGDRDKGKRPLMGEAASANADFVIVTDDNPRGEDPATIRSEILAAAPGAIEIGDRGEAIREALSMAEAGDVVLVAGKGHETGQIVGDQVLHFSDHEAINTAIAELTREALRHG